MLVTIYDILQIDGHTDPINPNCIAFTTFATILLLLQYPVIRLDIRY